MAIGADLAVGAEQGNPKRSGLGHQKAVSGIGVERLRQSRGRDRDVGIQRQQPQG